MTPKEKAKELTIKYYNNIHENSLRWEQSKWEQSKQCALICVDEVLDGNNDFLGRDIYATNIDFSDYENWIMVRDEIKQL